MRWRSFKTLLPAMAALLLSCRENKKSAFSYKYPGYYYQILSFNTDSFTYRPGQLAWASVTFKTQSDSVFWDSFNNMNDRFFIRLDSAAGDNFIRHFISGAAIADSARLLIRSHDFFSQQFGVDSIPFFSKGDTVVKVELKLKNILSPAEFKQMGLDLRLQEQRQIEQFFGSASRRDLAEDVLGFYWIDKPPPCSLPSIRQGDLLTLSYHGCFLNGRQVENSPAGFEYVYGTPDQLLKGLNYVIGKLKLGQTTKILLPSRLAFGENGSSNGTVPMFTPLIYELKIIDVKKPK